MFIDKALEFSTNLHEFCKRKDFEVCEIILELPYINMLVISVHRSPSGHFQLFLNSLEVIIHL